MKYVFYLLLAGFLFSGCKGEEKGDEVPMVDFISDQKVVLKDGNEIPLPKSGDETVLFIVRHGETNIIEKDVMASSLNEAGMQRREKIARMFSGIELNSVLAPMTGFATKFGELTATTHGTMVYNYNARDYGAFLEYVYGIEMGKRFVVIGYAHSIPDLLNLLTAGQDFPSIPDGVYNDLFVVTTKRRGQAKVWHLKY